VAERDRRGQVLAVGQGSVADWPCCFFLSVSSSKEDNLRLKTVVASARRLLKIEISFFFHECTWLVAMDTTTKTFRINRSGFVYIK
jgi:hypothetical protein